MISVVMPVRNCERTVKAAVLSVFEQGIEDLELIAIVNGCTDETLSVLSSIEDGRLKIIESSPGLVPALNAGLRASSGDLIARQDADDIWYQGKLKSQLDFLSKNPEIDILGTQLEIVDKNYDHIRNTEYPIDHQEITRSLLSAVNPIGHSSVIYKRKILDKCSGYLDVIPFLNDAPYSEDMDLWIRCIPWYKMANLSEVFVRYTHVQNPKYDHRVPQTIASWYRILYGVK